MTSDECTLIFSLIFSILLILVGALRYSKKNNTTLKDTLIMIWRECFVDGFKELRKNFIPVTKTILGKIWEYAKKKALYLVTQFNHPRELTKEAAKAVRAMIERGVQVRNQTVLLKGVNDDGKVLGDLLSGLTRIGACPYYIFQCRPVTGVHGQFQVPLLDGIKIVDAAKSHQNGFGKSVRYAMSHPRGKIEIICELTPNTALFKFHQSKYAEDSAKVFTAPLSPTDTWLTDGLEGM